jgi:hypothetical protein
MTHTERAQRVLNSMASVRVSTQNYAQQQFAGRAVPPFSCSLLWHEGEISLAKLEGVAGGIDQLVPVGQAMSDMVHLLKTAQTLHWPLAVSEAAWPAVARFLQESDRLAIEFNHQRYMLRKAQLAET